MHTPVYFLSRRTAIALRLPLRWPVLALLLFAGAVHADNCDPIKAQIDAKMRAGGLVNFTLVTVEAGTATTGRVVGTCGMGSRRIVYLAGVVMGDAASGALGPAQPQPTSPSPQSSPSPSPARTPVTAALPPSARASERDSPADKIPTECKDGSVVVGPDCGNPRAVRMSRVLIEKAASAP